MKISFNGSNIAKDVARFEESTGLKVISNETFLGEADGHKYAPGQSLRLAGLVGYPDFNGEIITITSIREDGEYGKAYYFTTDNPALEENLNWVYEYRLEELK